EHQKKAEHQIRKPKLQLNCSHRNTTTTVHGGGLDWNPNENRAARPSETRRFR
ncbi:hypothetical protein A2U01_0057433, partial [Trifolium medium]|nr:hypothetical protein [Trifolium medium]